MSVARSTKARHPDAGDLVRLLDEAVRGSEREALLNHLVSCQRCSARFDELRQRSTALSQLLGAGSEVDWLPTRAVLRANVARRSEPATVRPRAARLAWAAMLLAAVTATAMVTTPLRAWLAEHARAMLSASRAVAERAESVAALPEARGLSVRFAPAAREIEFWLDTIPAGGTLDVRAVDGGETTVEVSRGNGIADLVVMPNGIRVRNGLTPSADYRLIVPGEGRPVRVRVGTVPASRDTVVTASRDGIRLDLAAFATRK